ncbi:YggT family protein [Psychrosphaera ytuae]|uniref:YggT family protein n=1 Tax=Psychrosphaera ytuae TaxID=2820710 RepID=A0A975DBR9_9GAMM|nr:YggT family protein [Psychrosphaera ytuae]QTH63953.1 YggT family protein [Psychrosphaera ytuae]
MQATQFLVSTLFDLYLMVVVLRVWLQMARADFYNPVSQFVVKATNPLLVPLRKVIPGFGGLDIAGFVLVFAVAMAKVTTLQLMFGQGLPIYGLMISALITVISEVFTLVFWVTIIRAILSWISQGYNPIEALLHQLTEPLLAPIRKVIPPMGGLDLSLLVFLIGLQFFQLLVNDLLRAIL